MGQNSRDVNESKYLEVLGCYIVISANLRNRTRLHYQLFFVNAISPQTISSFRNLVGVILSELPKEDIEKHRNERLAILRFVLHDSEIYPESASLHYFKDNDFVKASIKKLVDCIVKDIAFYVEQKLF